MIRRTHLATTLAIGLLAGVASTAGLADEPVANLEGIWIKSAGQIIYANGEINAFPHSYDIAQIEITGQVGAVFKATQSTVALDHAQDGHHATQPIEKGGLPIIGVIGWDGSSVTLSDVGDTTIHQCTLVEVNTMHCTVWEAGDHALAGRIVLRRQ